MEYLYINNNFDITKAYKNCRDIFKKSSKSYYLGALLFDSENFLHICSFYAFVRIVDDIVDNSKDSNKTKKENLKLFKEKFFLIYDKHFINNIENKDFWKYCGITKELWAFFFTIYSIGIERNLIEKFFNSMEMDLYKFEYQNFSELEEYMEGSACVIGEIMYIIIKSNDKIGYYKEIEKTHNMNEYARNLGMAFQLTNFIRDILEDYEMEPKRIYIPKDHQKYFRINLDKFLYSFNNNKFSRFLNLLHFELRLSEILYKEAQIGINLIDYKQKKNIEIAKNLYHEINKEIRINKFSFLKCKKINVSTYRKVMICYNTLGILGLVNLAKRYIYYTYLI